MRSSSSSFSASSSSREDIPPRKRLHYGVSTICLISLIANLRTPSAQPALPSHTLKVADIAQQVRLILHTLHTAPSHIQFAHLHVFKFRRGHQAHHIALHRITALTHTRPPTDKPLRPRKWLASTIALPSAWPLLESLPRLTSQVLTLVGTA